MKKLSIGLIFVLVGLFALAAVSGQGPRATAASDSEASTRTRVGKKHSIDSHGQVCEELGAFSVCN